MQRHVFFIFLLSLCSGPAFLKPALAEDGCLQVRVSSAPRILRWEGKEFTSGDVSPASLLTADIDGDGVSELIVRAAPDVFDGSAG